MSDLPPLPETPTGRYRHYKGGQYEVIGVARHSETLEPLVIYRPLDNASGLWVRPHAMFFGAVEVDGQRQPRFARVDAAPAGAADLVHRALTDADAPAFSALRREVVADFPLGMGLTLQEELPIHPTCERQCRHDARLVEGVGGAGDAGFGPQ